MNTAYKLTVFALRFACIAGLAYGIYSALAFTMSVVAVASARGL